MELYIYNYKYILNFLPMLLFMICQRRWEIIICVIWFNEVLYMPSQRLSLFCWLLLFWNLFSQKKNSTVRSIISTTIAVHPHPPSPKSIMILPVVTFYEGDEGKKVEKGKDWVGVYCYSEGRGYGWGYQVGKKQDYDEGGDRVCPGYIGKE